MDLAMLHFFCKEASFLRAAAPAAVGGLIGGAGALATQKSKKPDLRRIGAGVLGGAAVGEAARRGRNRMDPMRRGGSKLNEALSGFGAAASQEAGHTQRSIRDTFRRAALKHHPDLGGSDAAMAAANAAHEAVLGSRWYRGLKAASAYSYGRY